MLAVLNEVANDLAGRRCAQNGRIILLLKERRFGVNDDAVGGNLLREVCDVAAAAEEHQATTVGQRVEFNVHVGVVQRDHERVRSRARHGNFILPAVCDELDLVLVNSF